MRKTSLKTRSVQRNPYTVELAKSQQLAGRARVRNPAKRAGKRRAPRQPACLTTTEKDRFFRAIKNPRDRAIFRLTYHCGLRASEVGLLLLSDYRKGQNVELDRINVHRLKGSISGEAFVVPEAAKAVRAWLRRRGDIPGPLFPSRHRRAISRARIFSLFRKYAADAGLPPEKRFPHILKHSCVTDLLEMHEDLLAVQRHVGHSSIGSTMKYIHVRDAYDEARAQRLANWK